MWSNPMDEGLVYYEERSWMWNREDVGSDHTIWRNSASWNDVKSCNTSVKQTDGSGVDVFELQIYSLYSYSCFCTRKVFA